MSYKPTVYIETSIVSYLVARPSNDVVKLGHQIITLEWWETQMPRIRPVVSQYVLDEAERGDPEAAQKRIGAIRGFEILPTTSAVELLAQSYLDATLVPKSEPMDPLHLALASVHAIDYLVTWNCRHLASAAVRRRIVGINTGEGFSTPITCTPDELMEN